VVLFGGTPGRDDPSLGDTWLFDGAAWHSVPGPGPPARRYAALGYDPDLGGCVLNGGSEDDDGRCGFGDTWLFRDRAWERLASPFDTEVHDDHGLVYHRAARRLVMFGGLGAAHGARVREAGGWAWVDALPVQARHQCAPLAWDEALEGVVYHGGEAHHAGPQFDTTWVLQLADTAARTTRRPPPPAPPDEPEEETGLGAFFRRIVRRLSGEE
jgi:hypothetical protein